MPAPDIYHWHMLQFYADLCGGINHYQQRCCALICRHDLWELGGLKIVTRSFTNCIHAVLPHPEGLKLPAQQGEEPSGRGVVVRAKMEYQGCTEQELEEVTLQEQARWWMALKLHPGSALLVWLPSPPPTLSSVALTAALEHNAAAHARMRASRKTCMCPHPWHRAALGAVDDQGCAMSDAEVGHEQVARTAVAESKVVRVDTFHADDIAVEAAFLCTLLAKLLSMLRQQPCGRYLLSHGPKASSIVCLQALPPNAPQVWSADLVAAARVISGLQALSWMAFAWLPESRVSKQVALKGPLSGPVHSTADCRPISVMGLMPHCIHHAGLSGSACCWWTQQWHMQWTFSSLLS